MMKLLVVGCVMLLCSIKIEAVGKAKASPKTMIHILIHDTDIVRSDVALPKIRIRVALAEPRMWRVDLLDSGRTLHCTIRNGRELWVADPSSGTASLVTDTLADTAPLSLFMLPEAPAIQALEIGKEASFFATHRTTRLPDVKVDTIACEVYRFDTTNASVTLWLGKRRSLPVQIGIKTSNNEYKVRYDVYMQRAPFDTVAFKLPDKRWLHSVPNDQSG